MSIQLSKGQNVNLSKDHPNVTEFHAGLYWNPRTTAGVEFDLDASAFLLGADGKCKNEGDFIFYNHQKHATGAVESTGDNRTGAGDGDDETLVVKLNLVPADIQKIVFVVTIYEFASRGQNFGQVDGAGIRLLDASNPAAPVEVAKFDLTEDGSILTAVIFAELYRNGTDWKFKAVGQGHTGGLGDILKDYGLS